MSLQIRCSNYVFFNFPMEINEFWDFDCFVIAGNLLFDLGIKIIQILTVSNLVKRRNLIFALRWFVDGIDFIVSSGRLAHEWEPIVWISNVTNWRKVAIYSTFGKLTSFDFRTATRGIFSILRMIMILNQIWIAPFDRTHRCIFRSFPNLDYIRLPYFLFLLTWHFDDFFGFGDFYLS